MKKKFLALALTAVMALSLAACGGDTQSTDTDADTSGDESASGSQTYTVGIIQQVQHEALDAATQGFQDALTELLGDSVTIDPQNASGDTANCTTIANNFVSQGVDLIMANGTTALQAAATGTSTIPILGTSITEYGVALGIDGFTGTTGYNVSGTSDLAPLDQQAEMLHTWFPDAQTVGLLYCSAEPNSQYQVDTVKAELEKLNHTRIKIGIQGNADSELLMIARVHEYGATITPKATRNLCIPIHKDSYDKSPRDFQDLFFIRSRDGYLFGVVAKKGRRDKDNPNNLKFLFLLLPSVTIPERSFIRAGFDHNKNKLAEIVQNEVARIWQGQQTADGAISWIGGQAVGLIQQFMSDASNFEPKGKIQRERYPSYADSPLMVTGRLRNSITWEVEE